MVRLKHRKIVFWMLIGTLAGTSMAFYAQSDANFFLKTFEVVVVQQIATAIIYLSCFGQDLFRS